MRIACPACRRLLFYVAEILEQVGPTDAVARLGVDEFAIALAGLQGRAIADLVARKVVALAGQEFQLAGRKAEAEAEAEARCSAGTGPRRRGSSGSCSRPEADLCRQRQPRAQHEAGVLERQSVGLRAFGSDRVARDDQLKIPHICIVRGEQHALMG